MKSTKIMFAGVAALALASCSNDEVVQELNEANVISFTASTAGNSRAADIFCSENMPGKFYVNATDVDGTEFFAEDAITKQDGTWKNEDGSVRYWPTKSLNFYAYNEEGKEFFNSKFATNPQKHGAEFAATYPAFENFTVKDNVAEQVDLLYAVAKDQSRTTNAGKVALNFHHALSQIAFKATCTNSNYKVTLNSISVGNVYGAGNYVFSNSTTSGTIAHPDGTVTNSNGHGVWEETGALKNFTVNFDTPVVLTNEVKDLTSVQYDADGKEIASSFANALLMIPQTADAIVVDEGTIDKSKGTFLLLNVKIENADNGYVMYEGEARVPVNITWMEGNRYCYTITIGNGGFGYIPTDDNNVEVPVLLPISYEVSVDEFKHVIENDVNDNNIK